MKLNHLLLFSLCGTSATHESAQVNKSMHSSSYFHLDGTETAVMDDAMDATLTEKEFSGVKVVVVDDNNDDDDEFVRMVIEVEGNPPKEEWGDRVCLHRKEDIYNTQHDDNEVSSDKTDANEVLKALAELVAEVDAKAKIRADKEDELQKLLADKTDENAALKARLAEVDAKAKFQAADEQLLRKLLADKTDENAALKARLADEVDAKAKFKAVDEQCLRKRLADKDENAALKARLAEVDAKAEWQAWSQADNEQRLRKRLDDKTDENKALKARLAEVESKNSWLDTKLDQQRQIFCVVFGKDRPGCMWMLNCLDIMVNQLSWVTQFVDPGPICDTFSYAMDLVDGKRRSD